MPIVEAEFAPLGDPRLAARLAEYATSPLPVWLWSADGGHILWTNAVGAAIFGASDIAAATRRLFAPNEAAAAAIVGLGTTLPSTGQPRLERLRGFGAGLRRLLTCSCVRLSIEATAAVLVVSTEPAGPALSLAQRLRRLFADDGRARAAFTPDGALLDGTAAALARFNGAATVAALHLDVIANQAFGVGSADGITSHGPAIATRLGTGTAAAVLISFAAQPSAADDGPDRQKDIEAPLSAALRGHEAPPAEAGAAVAEASAPPSPQSARHDEAPAGRRHPLRFVWQMDADGRFVIGSDEFIELMGPRTTAAFGRVWSEIATELKLDPEDQVGRAIATRETWSGIVVLWPVDERSERLPVELSGLPVFDRARSFRGYRGFGVCRDIGLINQLARLRRDGSSGFVPERGSVTEEPPVLRSGPQVDRRAAAPSMPAEAFPEVAQATGPASASPVIGMPAAKPSVSDAATANVLPFRTGAPIEPRAPTLSPVERKAFGELAQELTARLRATRDGSFANAAAAGAAADKEAMAEVVETAAVGDEGEPASISAAGPAGPPGGLEPLLLDRIPVGVLVHRQNSLIYANRQLLEWTGYDSIDAFAAAGGLNTLFAERDADALSERDGVQAISILTRAGDRYPIDARLFTVAWNGQAAVALVLTGGKSEHRRAAAAATELREIKAMLDAAADGAVVLDCTGTIAALTGGAEKLFGRPAGALYGHSLGELFAPESEPLARERFDAFARGEPQDSGAIDVMARAYGGERTPLSMTLTRIGDERFCAIFRNNAPMRKLEEDLRAARREGQRTATTKAEFLAKVSHEIRTPLNAITGFAEVIMAERFGPIGNERYVEYLKDIHAAGTHIATLLNDLLDLSKVETGQLDLTFANVSLNELTQQCVGIMQPQASRGRIVIRTSLTPGLPQVIADERSLRQIVLNLLSNSIRFTGPGGQVIVSTAFADSGEAVLRVRDNGAGMSEKDVEAALEPFRQRATSATWGSGGTGLGLPLTKALAEANRANFNIKSAPNAGTLIEVAFPPARVVAR